MATYHNEKTLSEIALVNCFNKITANGIRTAADGILSGGHRSNL